MDTHMSWNQRNLKKRADLKIEVKMHWYYFRWADRICSDYATS